MILRIRTPRESHDIDLGPTAHVPLRGHSLRGTKVEGGPNLTDAQARRRALLAEYQRRSRERRGG